MRRHNRTMTMMETIGQEETSKPKHLKGKTSQTSQRHERHEVNYCCEGKAGFN